MCNVLSNAINSYHTIPIKGCNEIRFSNGGHLFACVYAEKNVNLYNFYTGETTETMSFIGHQARVMSIDWFANDMGFTTCGLDGNIYFYDLYQPQLEPGKRNIPKDKYRRNVQLSSVVNLPGHPYEFIAVGDEKIILTFTDKLKSIPRQTSVTEAVQTVPVLPELRHHLSQLVIHHSGKILFAGVGELGDPYPGAIQVWKLPFEKAAEIQAHASPVTRLRISNTNTHLFSVGQDGMLAIFDVKDRDPKRDPEGVQGALKYSEQILSDKNEVEQLISEEE